MKNKFYKGVVPALSTPLHKDETIDEEGLSRLIEYNISAEGGSSYNSCVLIKN
jgi:dihydrodipicolinate synthase/N-acetylneuraminate lyase